MIVLALDTALSAASVAVLDGDRVLAARSEPMERGHQERIGGLVRDAMGDAGVGFAAVGRIGVTVGPGSFTGLRVGLSFAKGLALAYGAPCVGVGTLDALAAGTQTNGVVIAAIDARRGQLYWQMFEDGAARSEPEALTLSAAQARLEAEALKGLVTLVGSGAAVLSAPPNLVVDPRPYPDPVVIARRALREPSPSAWPTPLYLRAPDARTIAERAAAP